MTMAEPLVPEAIKFVPEQEVVLVLLQLSVDDCPLVMEVGLAESEAVGVVETGPSSP
jgi:hypothetical protein